MIKGRYDVVVSDWNSPGVDAIRLLQNARQNPKMQKMVFIITTLHTDVESIAGGGQGWGQ